jgi:hypothetical protein
VQTSMYFSLSQLLFNSLYNASSFFPIFASIFWRSVSMYLLLTTYHTLLLFSPPLLQTSPIPGLFSSCSSFFSQFSPFSIVCYFNASLTKLVSSMSHNLFQYFTILSIIFSFLFVLPNSLKSRVRSGSIVSDYGLDDRAIGVRSPAGVKDFSSILCVLIGSGVHPASCTMGTGVFPRG